MNKKDSIFREKSLERISSPEQLDKYIKVSTPKIWTLLSAIVIVLIGVIIWGVVGKIESKSSIGCKVDNGATICYIKESEVSKINDETYVLIDDEKYNILKISEIYEANNESDSYLLHSSNISDGEWYYVVTLNKNIKTTNSKAVIIYESISPIRFVLQ